MSKKVGLGAKRELDADLNLTPFIDLLSTIVCFLLITAVWIEIGSVEIKQSHGTEAAASKEVTYDLDVVYQNPLKIRLNLKRNGKRIKKYNVTATDEAGIQEKLDSIIRNQVTTYRKKIIKIATATITPRSSVNYGNLIATLDTLRKNSIINIGVLSAKGQ